jgi:hypothetical protein
LRSLLHIERDGTERPLVTASVANIENSFMKLSRLNTAASGSLQ